MAGTFSISEGIFGLLDDVFSAGENIYISRLEAETAQQRAISQAQIAGAGLEAQVLQSTISQRNLIIAGVGILAVALVIGLTRR